MDFPPKNVALHYANANKFAAYVLLYSVRPLFFHFSLPLNCVNLSCRVGQRDLENLITSKVNWSASIRHATQSHSHSHSHSQYSYSRFIYIMSVLIVLFLLCTPLLTYCQFHSVVLTFSNKSLQQSPYFFIGSSLLEQRFSNLIECKHCRHTFRFSLNFICESHKTRPIEWMYSTSSAYIHTAMTEDGKTGRKTEPQQKRKKNRRKRRRRKKRNNEHWSFDIWSTFWKKIQTAYVVKHNTQTNFTYQNLNYIYIVNSS